MSKDELSSIFCETPSSWGDRQNTPCLGFPSHFILSLLDVYRNTATRDKLIISFAITRLLRHFFVSFQESPYFTVISAIDAAAIDATTIRWSAAQLRPRQPQIETATPPTSTAPSTSAPSSFEGGVTLKAIMAQLVCMNARLNTISDELCQVNTRVCRIAQQ